MLNLINKLRRDRGDSVLVTIIICIPLFMLAFMFSVGLAMNAWIKTSFADAAQAAAQTAASDINNAGYLDEGSAGTFVSEYMRLTQRTSGTAAQIAAGGYETKGSGIFTCNTVTVDGVDHPSPYIEVSLDRTRARGVGDQASPLYVSSGGSTPESVFTLNTRVNYRVISATVYEASTSLLGDGFAMLGEDAGCYTSRTEVSGITFGANEDLSTIGGDASCWTPDSPTDIEDAVMRTNGSIKLYSGADYTCPVVGYLNSPYILTTHEYGSFYQISYGGNDYWVHNLDVRAPEACTDRSISDRKTTISPTQQYSTGDATDVKAYSAPFPDCETSSKIEGEVTVKTKYVGPYGTYYQLTDGKWVDSNDVKAMRTITFNPNGGSGGGTVRMWETGKINAYASPTRAGYIFAGWFTSATGGTQVSFPHTVSGNATYYAHWGASSYSITWNGGGGTVAGCSPTTYNVTSGAFAPNSSSCNTISRAGYTFAGWSPTSIPAGSIGNKTFTAKWTVVNYSITYNMNGGSTPNCTPTSYNVNSSTITPSCKPTRTNYAFEGWSPSSIPAGSTGNKTLTAQWKLNTHTVTLNTRGGTAIGAKTVVHGEKLSLPTPKRSGWTFWGWSTDSRADTNGGSLSGAVSSPRTITSNQTLYAHWHRKVSKPFTQAANAWADHPTTDSLRGYVSCSRGSLTSKRVTVNFWGAGGSGWTGWHNSGTIVYGIYARVGYNWGPNYGWAATAEGHCAGTTTSTQYD